MVTKEMVKFWLGKDGSTEIIEDYTDIANGKYEPVRLKQDIIETWRAKNAEKSTR